MSLEDTLYPFRRLYEKAPQPVKQLAGGLYRTLPTRVRLGAGYSRFRTEAKEVQTWDAGEIEGYQVAALKETLRAAAQAPYYKALFAAKDLDPEKFDTLEQLQDYPLLTKKDLLQGAPSFCNPHFGTRDRIYITTGGSSGIPVGFYLHRGVSRPKEQAYLESQWGRRGWQPGDRTAVIRGAVVSSHSEGRISYYDATRDWLMLSSYHLTEERLPEYLDQLNRFRPKHLHVYPSAALLLARWMEAHDVSFDFPLVSVLCGSEKLTTEAQGYLERIFKAPVLHWYGHSERVVLAAQGTRSNHLYFWPFYGYVEFGEENEEGHREVIGTSFHNHVMPLVRYRTGDYVKVADQADREYPWLEIESVAGREYEFLVSSKGRRISLTAVNMHDKIFDGLYAIQFVQHEAGKVECRYEAGPNWQESRADAIRRGLHEKIGEDFELSLVPVKEVEKTAGGKARWLISSLQLPSSFIATL